MQRVAERHDLHRQWNTEFVKHCDYFIKAWFSYMVSGQPGGGEGIAGHLEPGFFRIIRTIFRGASARP